MALHNKVKKFDKYENVAMQNVKFVVTSFFHIGNENVTT